MNPLLRASVIAVSTLACTLASVDGRAEVRRSCIRSLELQASAADPKPTMSPKKACPIAIAYAPRSHAPRAGRSIGMTPSSSSNSRA